MSDYLDNEIAGACDDTLHQWMANAIATTTCSGHGKGNANEARADRYRAALIDRGVSIPEIDFWKCLDNPDSYRDQLHKVGVYNGPGSY